MPVNTKQDSYQPVTFDAVKIGLASPEKIREWSHGEVTKPEGDVLELTTMTEEDFNAIAQSLGGLFGTMAPAAEPAA